MIKNIIALWRKHGERVSVESIFKLLNEERQDCVFNAEQTAKMAAEVLSEIMYECDLYIEYKREENELKGAIRHQGESLQQLNIDLCKHITPIGLHKFAGSQSWNPETQKFERNESKI